MPKKKKTETKEDFEKRASELRDGTVLLDCSISAYGNRAKIASELLGTDADPELVHGFKTLIDSDALSNVLAFLRKVRESVRRMSVPSPFRGGMYLAAIAAVKRIDDFLVERTEALAPLLDALVAELPKAVAESEKRLKGLFDPSDYPSEATLRGSFAIRWKWISIGTPDKLAEVNAGILDRERRKAEDAVRVAVADLTTLLREEFGELVRHLVERLGSDDDGKPKRFKDATIRNLSEFVEFFDLRNVASDGELFELVEKTKSLLEGVDPKKLRKKADFREKTRDAFRKIAKNVETLPKPIRSFDWSE